MPDTELFDDLDRRITIEVKSVAQDESGQEIETWAPIATKWAGWRRASARETLAAAEVAAAVTDVFKIRYSAAVAGMDPGNHRLLYGGRAYDIVEVTEIGRQRGLRITAMARAD